MYVCVNAGKPLFCLEGKFVVVVVVAALSTQKNNLTTIYNNCGFLILKLFLLYNKKILFNAIN